MYYIDKYVSRWVDIIIICTIIFVVRLIQLILILFVGCVGCGFDVLVG